MLAFSGLGEYTGRVCSLALLARLLETLLVLGSEFLKDALALQQFQVGDRDGASKRIRRVCMTVKEGFQFFIFSLKGIINRLCR